MQDASSLLRDGLLTVLLLTALVIDLRTLRVPNLLSFGGALLGLAMSFVPARGLPDFGHALGGLATGYAVLLPLYLLRILGAGDVKLAGMCGAFLGSTQVLVAILFSYIAAGLLALAFAAWRGVGRKLLWNVGGLLASNAAALASGAPLDLRVADSAGRFPFATAMCTGTLTLLALAHFL